MQHRGTICEAQLICIRGYRLAMLLLTERSELNSEIVSLKVT